MRYIPSARAAPLSPCGRGVGGEGERPPTTTLANSTTQLTTAGIEVHTSNCATQTGVAVMTVCSAPTLGIHLHKINASDVQKATDIGYEEATNLINEEHGTGYEITISPPPH